MKISADIWAAIGACATAIIAFLSYCCQKKSVLQQKQSYDLQKESLALQNRIHKGHVFLTLERNGKYISTILQNTGDYIVYNIKILTIPTLEVPECNHKHSLSISRSWLIPNTAIKQMLPHQILRDNKAFLASDFDRHFQGDFTINATISYIQDGKSVTSKQIIDSALLARIEHENVMRKYRNDEDVEI